MSIREWIAAGLAGAFVAALIGMAAWISGYIIGYRDCRTDVKDTTATEGRVVPPHRSGGCADNMAWRKAVTDEVVDRAYYTVSDIRAGETVVGNFRTDDFYRRIRRALEDYECERGTALAMLDAPSKEAK